MLHVTTLGGTLAITMHRSLIGLMCMLRYKIIGFHGYLYRLLAPVLLPGGLDPDA
jgi:hypothetical protein